MTSYRVKTIVAVLPLKAGSERYFYRDAVVTSDQITKAGVEHALSSGLIEEVEVVLEDAAVIVVEPVTPATEVGPDLAVPVVDEQTPARRARTK